MGTATTYGDTTYYANAGGKPLGYTQSTTVPASGGEDGFQGIPRGDLFGLINLHRIKKPYLWKQLAYKFSHRQCFGVT